MGLPPLTNQLRGEDILGQQEWHLRALKLNSPYSECAGLRDHSCAMIIISRGCVCWFLLVMKQRILGTPPRRKEWTWSTRNMLCWLPFNWGGTSFNKGMKELEWRECRSTKLLYLSPIYMTLFQIGNPLICSASWVSLFYPSTSDAVTAGSIQRGARQRALAFGRCVWLVLPLSDFVFEIA